MENEVLVADGAMGTVLQTRGITIAHPYEYASLTHPELVLSVHQEYVQAGSRMIETNTFGANRIKLSAYGLADQASELNAQAGKLARRAAGGKVLVAGAVGPCGKPLEPVGTIEPHLAMAAFREQATALIEAGVDLILLETFSDLEELRLAYQVIHQITDIAIIAQKVFIEDGETLAAGLPARFAEEVSGWPGIAAVGANCVVGPQRMREIVKSIASSTKIPVSAMPTPGLPQFVAASDMIGGTVRYAVSPAYFGQSARELVEAGASIVGGCCGTSPQHIAEAAKAVSEIKPIYRVKPVTAIPIAPAKEPVIKQPPSAPSRLSRILGQKYVITVELDLPRGLDITKVLDGAKAMKARGGDLIDISDGARARLRMNPMAVAHLIQEQVGIEVMMHFACRDRNLLAVQADLLGAHALGIRNILAITGDPAAIGDYPSATSVFDIDSIGLIRILRRFNEGFDLAGNSIGRETAFTIAAAFDPLAPDLRLEKERLKRKAEAGAHLVYTQPIFERGALEESVKAAKSCRLPIFFGLLPLRSSRHAEFMHNEVPGISIPAEIRSRLAEISDEEGRRYGIEVAQQFLAAAKAITDGVYLMPPFGNYRVAEAVLEALE